MRIPFAESEEGIVKESIKCSEDGASFISKRSSDYINFTERYGEYPLWGMYKIIGEITYFEFKMLYPYQRTYSYFNHRYKTKSK